MFDEVNNENSPLKEFVNQLQEKKKQHEDLLNKERILDLAIESLQNKNRDIINEIQRTEHEIKVDLKKKIMDSNSKIRGLKTQIQDENGRKNNLCCTFESVNGLVENKVNDKQSLVRKFQWKFTENNQFLER